MCKLLDMGSKLLDVNFFAWDAMGNHYFLPRGPFSIRYTNNIFNSYNQVKVSLHSWLSFGYTNTLIIES